MTSTAAHQEQPLEQQGDRLSVVHVVAGLGTGGAERQIELLVEGSAHESLTVALYGAGTVAESMQAAGHRVEVLGMAGWRKLAALFLLTRRLRRIRPDVVHVHLLPGQLWGIPAARLAGVPVVVSSEHSLMNDTIEGRPLSWWLLLVYRGLERLTTRTVAVSATTADRLVRLGIDRRRITVSDNGIDFAHLGFDDVGRSRVRAELGLGRDATVIGAVGRLEPVKRMDVVLRASAPWLARGAHLVVAGDGPLLGDLRRLSEELGVADQVHLLGPRADVSSVLSACDLLVSGCADETFGMAVVEGLASGLPTVYVECPALEELPEHPAHAHQAETATDPEEAAQLLRAGIDEVLAGAPATLARYPVPAALSVRYGAASACRRNDDLYQALHRARVG